ncbi:MAG: hypothetical protein IPP07_08945 [Holophagales bacterium]|nr:hypothetical protein [Holophagales bacterium]
MSHAHSHALPGSPRALSLPDRPGLAIAFVLIGGAALGWAFAGGHAQLAWSAYLIGSFFALGLGVFGAAWLAILYLARGNWSVTMRRIPEAMTAWLLPGGVLTLAVGLGAHSLYHWSHAEAVATTRSPAQGAVPEHDDVLRPGGRQPGPLGRLRAAHGGHLAPPGPRGRHRRVADRRTLSAIFLVVFALTISVVSFYFLLSLDAHWFSTMFAVLVFTDVVQTGTAFVAVAGPSRDGGRLKGFLNENHLHSLAKMVFAATGFWAYIYFCQYMLIWYANLPEETVYFLKRSGNGWLPYLLILPLLKFVVPFLFLLPRDAKRQPGQARRRGLDPLRPVLGSST